MTDAELIQTTQDFREGILDGRSPYLMCAAVCWPLQGYLSALCGIKTECVETVYGPDSASQVANHVWLRLPDGRVLDPTFDHFSDDVSVYLGPPTEFHVDAGLATEGVWRDALPAAPVVAQKEQG